MKNGFCENYKKLDNVKIKNLDVNHTHIKAFPLKAELFEKDCPMWDSPDLSEDLQDKIISLENKDIIEDYYDAIDHAYEHKVGGYPSFCQGGVSFGKGFEFAFQVSSDAKANFNVVDNGSLMFAKNNLTDEWTIYWDCY